jgi:hypothetical protein
MGGSWSWRERGILAGGRDVVPSNPLTEVKDIFDWGRGARIRVLARHQTDLRWEMGEGEKNCSASTIPVAHRLLGAEGGLSLA